jgi:hypothetical protein
MPALREGFVSFWAAASHRALRGTRYLAAIAAAGIKVLGAFSKTSAFR